MKIAFTAKGTEWDSMMDPRFGRTQFILIYDDHNQILTSFNNSAVEHEAHGAGTATAQKIFELSPDVLITGNGPGSHAVQALKQINMRIFTEAHNMTIKQAFEKYKNGELKEI
jgi:predicted Fe-Mo cluster-binding NifX family protein